MKLQSIQALRGIAAMLVVVYHAGALETVGIAKGGSTEAGLIGGLFASGFAGVDLFFVISGFIMVWVTLRDRPGLPASGEFLFARLTRIYPVWWAAAALTLIYMWVSADARIMDTSGSIVQPGTPGFDFILKSFLLVPQSDAPVLLLGWTLIHEVYFYLVFALILLLPRGLMPFALLVWGGMVVAASMTGLSTPSAQGLLTLAVHPMTMEFIFGAAVGLMVTSGLIWRAGVITLVSTLWLIAAIGLQSEPTHYTLQWGRVLEIGVPCAALVYGVSGLDAKGRLAWLVPALAGALAGGLIFQQLGLTPAAPLEARRDAAILSVLIGGIAMLTMLWTGWLLGQARPHWLHSMTPGWRRLLAMASRSGDWSYSIYLFHIFALAILQRLMLRVPEDSAAAPWLRLGAPGIGDNILFLTGSVLASLAAGWLGYRLIERPSLTVFGWLRQKLFRRNLRF